MKQNLEGSRNWNRLVCPVILTVLMLAIGGLCLLTVHSSDDFWYSTFLDEGLGAYIRKMADHYKTFNGRVWVHILAHILLYTGNWLFALVCCGCVLAMPLLMGRAAGGDRSRCMMGAVLFGILFAAMPVSFFVEGVLWISAFCNYLVPTLVLCLMLWQLEEDRPAPGLMLSAFLCGSATEQMGMMALALLVLYLLADPRKRMLRLAALVCAAGGLATVFASPATESRATSEIPLTDLSALLDRVLDSFWNMSYILSGELTIPLLLAALMLLCAMVLKKRHPAPFWLGICGAAVCLWALLASGPLRVGLSAGALVLLGLLALGLVLVGQRFAGITILTALASLAVMLPTSSVGCRNVLPFYLLVILTIPVLGLQLLPEKWERPLGWTAAVCATVVLLGLLPLARGSVSNFRLQQQNLEQAGQSAGAAQIPYDVGYDLRYTYTKAYASEYFAQKYLESVHQPTDTRLELTCGGHPLPQVICSGTALELRAIPAGQEILLLPLRPVVETLGGTLHWEQLKLDLELNGIRCRLYNLGAQQVQAEWTDLSGRFHRENYCRSLVYANGYYDARLLQDIFGLDVIWNSENRTYTVIDQ